MSNCMHIYICKEIKHLYPNFRRGLTEFMLHPRENYNTGSNSCPDFNELFEEWREANGP